MKIEIDTSEIVAQMMEHEPTPTRQVWEFYMAMKKLHPEFMHAVECMVEYMDSMKRYEREVNHAR